MLCKLLDVSLQKELYTSNVLLSLLWLDSSLNSDHISEQLLWSVKRRASLWTQQSVHVLLSGRIASLVNLATVCSFIHSLTCERRRFSRRGKVDEENRLARRIKFGF